MGCCISQEDKLTVYEVTIDANGVAHRVPNGKGTHLIHVSDDGETNLEEKPSVNSDDLSKPPPTHHMPRLPFLGSRQDKRVEPLIVDEEKAPL